MNGIMLNASMTGITAKENSGVLDMNNMAFYYHALPPVDDILRSWVNGANTEKIISKTQTRLVPRSQYLFDLDF